MKQQKKRENERKSGLQIDCFKTETCSLWASLSWVNSGVSVKKKADLKTSSLHQSLAARRWQNLVFVVEATLAAEERWTHTSTKTMSSLHTCIYFYVCVCVCNGALCVREQEQLSLPATSAWISRWHWISLFSLSSSAFSSHPLPLTVQRQASSAWSHAVWRRSRGGDASVNVYCMRVC